MNPLAQWLSEFAHDSKIHVLLLLVAADFFFGVAAAFRMGTFRLAYVAAFAKDDIMGKVLPYFGLYALALVAGNEDLVIPGLDFGVVAGAAYVALIGALTGSLLSSLRDLGIGNLPSTVAANEGEDPRVPHRNLSPELERR